jgi:molecular chaperone DnaJ
MADTSTTPTPTKAIPISGSALPLTPTLPVSLVAPSMVADRRTEVPPNALPAAISYGRPGQWLRAQFEAHAGRLGVLDSDPDAAPRDIRHLLSSAAAEENVAAVLASLGRSYTVWHNVVSDAAHPSRKLDHIVLGPTGLYALLSDDWGTSVRLSKGELRGPGLVRGEKPIRTLSRRARAFARDTGVRFSALMMVVPDDAVTAPLTVVRRGRNCPTLLVRRSWLPDVVRSKMSGIAPTPPDALDEAHAHLRETVRFV